MTTVALLGTGTMGAGMARTIAKAGHDLRVWNRSRERAEPLADVATVADDPAAAVQGADVVVTMLWDADRVAGGVKDVGLALDAVTGMGLDADDLALIAAAREHLHRAVAEGHGDLDIAATYLAHRAP
jgi:3-hydroxyisobutyrate dehydrogenase-like beta-hydroxyacid dehydrogenase